MKVARDLRLRNSERVPILPPHWRTLYELTKLDDVTFRRLHRNGTINPRLEQPEISKILRQQRIREDEERVRNLRPRRGRFRTLIFDPSWDYGAFSLAGRSRAD